MLDGLAVYALRPVRRAESNGKRWPGLVCWDAERC
jgi:hypothetical protein